MMGGSLVVALLGSIDGAPASAALARFAAIAALALAGTAAMSLLAPRVLRVADAESHDSTPAAATAE